MKKVDKYLYMCILLEAVMDKHKTNSFWKRLYRKMVYRHFERMDNLIDAYANKLG